MYILSMLIFSIVSFTCSAYHATQYANLLKQTEKGLQQSIAAVTEKLSLSQRLLPSKQMYIDDSYQEFITHLTRKQVQLHKHHEEVTRKLRDLINIESTEEEQHHLTIFLLQQEATHLKDRLAELSQLKKQPMLQDSNSYSQTILRKLVQEEETLEKKLKQVTLKLTQ